VDLVKSIKNATARILTKILWYNAFAEQLSRGGGIKNRYIINMFGQIYPGKPKYPKGALDGYNARQMYFLRCLNEILKIENLESIGFNYGIGCGLAGGDWNIYYNLINNFAQKTDAKVVLYQLNL
jgi:hypothetical protein